MSGLYTTYSSSNSAEMHAERMRAIAAEKAAFGNSVLQDVYYGGFLRNKPDEFVCKDGCNDGKISFREKVNNFCNGIIAPIKNMFATPKNIAITGLSVAAGVGLIALTGGAAAPVMVALGVIGGGTQIVTGLYKQATATTDEEAARAWKQMGSGTFAVGASVLSAKSSLKAAGVQNTSNMTTWQAVVNCIKNAPAFFSKAVSNASPKVATFMAGIKGTKATKSPKSPNTSSNIPLLENLKRRLGLNKGQPDVTVEPKVNVKPSTKANPPKVIELPEASVIDGSDSIVINNAGKKPIIKNQNQDVITLQGSERLALPEPKVRVRKTPADLNTPDVIIMEPPRRLGLPEPKVNTTSSSKIAAIKHFFGDIALKVKDSLKIFGIFLDKK